MERGSEALHEVLAGVIGMRFVITRFVLFKYIVRVGLVSIYINTHHYLRQSCSSDRFCKVVIP